MDIARLVQDAARLLADLQQLQRALEPAAAATSETGEIPGVDYSGELAASEARAQAARARELARTNAIRAQFGLPPLGDPGAEFTNVDAPHDTMAGEGLPPIGIGPAK